jgi:hypothetical protein
MWGLMSAGISMQSAGPFFLLHRPNGRLAGHRDATVE